MDVLRQSNFDYLKILGINNPNPNKTHRFLHYLIYYDVDNGKAIFNELTRSLIWLPYDQFNNVFNINVQKEDYIKYLWSNFFLVNDDYDEQKQQQKLKETFRNDAENENYLKSGKIDEYTIFTTMVCNARCFYCYEKGRPQKPMTLKTANDVSNYIIKTAVKTGYPIRLRWFGGEPLMGEHCIDLICKNLDDAGFIYKSQMTTNGFLLKKEKLSKYIDFWHLDDVQITIDGTENVYNKTKNYKNIKGKNPFKIVCDNVKMLADANITTSVRINVDTYNAEDVKDLIKQFHDMWGNHPFIHIYCYPIFEGDDNPRTEEQLKDLHEKLEELDNVLDQYGFYNKAMPREFLRAMHCMIDNGHAVVIGTEGDIGLCEHYSDDHFWGHINKPEMRDMNMIKSFQEYEPDLDICKTCKILPSCLRPKLCHDLRKCNIYNKKWRIREEEQGVKMLYHTIVNNRNNNNICNNCNENIIEEDKNITNNDYNKLSFFDKLKIKLKLK